MYNDRSKRDGMRVKRRYCSLQFYIYVYICNNNLLMNNGEEDSSVSAVLSFCDNRIISLQE